MVGYELWQDSVGRVMCIIRGRVLVCVWVE